MKNFFIYVIALIFVYSCSSPDIDIIDDNFSRLDKMFIDGFTMELEQIYVMNGNIQKVPIKNKPIDSLYTDSMNNVDLEFSPYGSGNHKNYFQQYQKVKFGKLIIWLM